MAWTSSRSLFHISKSTKTGDVLTKVLLYRYAVRYQRPSIIVEDEGGGGQLLHHSELPQRLHAPFSLF
jgi:hypothetical protein